ncbi:MAG: hypothetical protein IV107_16375 [Paucibacter sp.]|nr:hypothetical protein [Roseateles sp.]
MTPDIETKTYKDGASATGQAPLPDQSPAEQAERLLIKPTVGRKVWYRASAHDQTGPVPMSAQSETAGNPKRAPLDATVIAVHGDRMVNLLVIDVYGKMFPKLSVTLLQEGDLIPMDAAGNEIGGYAQWMPYQAGQARKAA